jgi:hypothetical protein
MPIEIKELVIKAVVGAKANEPAPTLKHEDIVKLKKEITKEVTEKILRTIQQKSER